MSNARHRAEKFLLTYEKSQFAAKKFVKFSKLVGAKSLLAFPLKILMYDVRRFKQSKKIVLKTLCHCRLRENWISSYNFNLFFKFTYARTLTQTTSVTGVASSLNAFYQATFFLSTRWMRYSCKILKILFTCRFFWLKFAISASSYKSQISIAHSFITLLTTPSCAVWCAGTEQFLSQ